MMMVLRSALGPSLEAQTRRTRVHLHSHHARPPAKLQNKQHHISLQQPHTSLAATYSNSTRRPPPPSRTTRRTGRRDAEQKRAFLSRNAFVCSNARGAHTATSHCCVPSQQCLAHAGACRGGQELKQNLHECYYYSAALAPPQQQNSIFNHSNKPTATCRGPFRLTLRLPRNNMCSSSSV